MDNHIPRIPSVKDREHTRVDAQVYLFVEPIELDQSNKNEGKGFSIPTFVQDEDDFVGLSIDAFAERTKLEKSTHAQEYLQIQQLLSMLKRFMDASILGRKARQYHRVKVNISGSGVAFPSDVAYHAGHLLRVCVFFPKRPFTHLSVVAEVVRSEKAELGYTIKTQFKQISDDSRAHILEFVEECQR